MTAIFGWIIIVITLGLASAVMLWPFFRLVKRRYPTSLGLVGACAAATAGFGVGLWYLIPFIVWGLFGRSSAIP